MSLDDFITALFELVLFPVFHPDNFFVLVALSFVFAACCFAIFHRLMR